MLSHWFPRASLSTKVSIARRNATIPAASGSPALYKRRTHIDLFVDNFNPIGYMLRHRSGAGQGRLRFSPSGHRPCASAPARSARLCARVKSRASNPSPGQALLVPRMMDTGPCGRQACGTAHRLPSGPGRSIHVTRRPLPEGRTMQGRTRAAATHRPPSDPMAAPDRGHTALPATRINGMRLPRAPRMAPRRSRDLPPAHGANVRIRPRIYNRANPTGTPRHVRACPAGNTLDFLKTGWGGRIRTCECRYQKPVPYHLATPQQEARL